MVFFNAGPTRFITTRWNPFSFISFSTLSLYVKLRTQAESPTSPFESCLNPEHAGANGLTVRVSICEGKVWCEQMILEEADAVLILVR